MFRAIRKKETCCVARNLLKKKADYYKTPKGVALTSFSNAGHHVVHVDAYNENAGKTVRSERVGPG